MEESSSGAADRPRPAASPPTATTPLPQPLELAAVLERPRGVSSIVDLKGAGVPSKPADLARSISELREGAQIFHDASQKRLSTRLLSLDGLAPAAAAELRGAYFLRAFLDGRATQALQGTPQEHYITADFFTPARCYILLPSLMRPPGWLHKHFRRFQVGESEAPAEEAHAAAGTSGASPGQRQQPDAAAAQELYACTVNVDLEVEWGHESLVRMLLFALSTTFSTQRLEVWQSKAVVRPGKPLVLGRALGGEDTDTNYVFAFKPLSADEVAAAEAEERAQLASPQAAGQGSSGVDRNRWIEQLVVQIESDDTDAVRKLLESARQLQPNGGSASTTSSPSRAKSAAAAAPSASGAASGGNGGVVSGSPSRASPGGRIASFDNGVTVDLTLHPLSPSPKLLCSVPLDYDNLEMLCLLMVRCNIEIDFACLHLLLANHSRVTSEFGGVQEVLLQYIQKHRNPLSSTAAICAALELLTSEGAGRNSKRLATLRERFRALLTKLADKLDDDRPEQTLLAAAPQQAQAAAASAPTAEEDAEAARSRAGTASLSAAPLPPTIPLSLALQPVLMPQPPPVPFTSTINDVSPLLTAFQLGDLNFMSTTSLCEYIDNCWKGPGYVALTAAAAKGNPAGHDNGMSRFNSKLAEINLNKMGFSNALVSRSLGPPLQLWFLVTLASTAFFNSPRGRWWLKVLHELGFLVVYQLVLFQPAPSNDFRYLHLSLLLYTTGNLVEAAQYALIKYRGNLTQYASDFFQALDVLLNAVLFAFMANYTLRSFGVLPASWPGEGGVSLAFATTAVFVWIRCLRVLVPLYRKLGPMLTTLTRMIGEVVAFVFPFLIVAGGFATSLQAMFRTSDSYSGFPASMLTMFQAALGNFDFVEIADASGADEARMVYGSVVLVLYLILAALLLTNLLIAIVTYRYKPDEVEQESRFGRALTVDRYAFQVDRHLVCAPLNLLQVPLQLLLPHRTDRRPADARKLWYRLALPPLDGETPSSGQQSSTNAAGGGVRTARGPADCRMSAGSAELPHLFFLLTLYPVLHLTAVAAFLLHAPLCIGYFALVGHRKRLWAQLTSWTRRRMMHGVRFLSGRCGGGGGGGGGSGGARGRERAAATSQSPVRDNNPAYEVDVPSGMVAEDFATVVLMAQRQPAGIRGGLGNVDDGRGESGGDSFTTTGSSSSSRLLARLLLGACRTVWKLIWGFMRSLLMLLFGVFLYLVVLGVGVGLLWGSYVFLAKVCWSLYNAFVWPLVDLLPSARVVDGGIKAEKAAEPAAGPRRQRWRRLWHRWKEEYQRTHPAPYMSQQAVRSAIEEAFLDFDDFGDKYGGGSAGNALDTAADEGVSSTGGDVSSTVSHRSGPLRQVEERIAAMQGALAALERSMSSARSRFQSELEGARALLQDMARPSL